MSVSAKFEKTMFPFVRQLTVDGRPHGLIFTMPDTLSARIRMIHDRKKTGITPPALDCVQYWYKTLIWRHLPAKARYLLVYQWRGMQTVGYYCTLGEIRGYVKIDILRHPEGGSK